MHEVLEHLYVGNMQDSECVVDFGLIVNCTKNIPFSSKSSSCKLIRVDVDDDGNPKSTWDLYNEFETVIPIIDAVIASNQDVLVHCFAGIQRSCTTVAAYLMSKKNMSAIESVRFLKEKREIAFHGGANFIKALLLWEETKCIL